MQNDSHLPPRDPGEAVPISQTPNGGTQHEGWSTVIVALLTTLAIVMIAVTAPVTLQLLLGPDLPADGAAMPAGLAWRHVLAFQIAVVVLTLLVAGAPARAAPGLGWRAPVARLSWLPPLLLTIAVSAATATIAFTFFRDILEQDLAPIRALVDAGPLWLAFPALAIGAPLSEELLFRGYLLHRLQHTPLGFWGGAIVANIGWTLMHTDYSWLGLTDVFIAGLLFSWALWRTGSIWVPIAFHALYNAIVFAILLYPWQNQTVPAIW